MTNVICLLIAWWCSTMYLGFFFCDDSQLLPRINYWKLSVKLKNWTKHFLLVALVLDFSKNRIIINALLNVNLYDSKYFSLSLLLLMVLFYLFIQYYAVLKEILVLHMLSRFLGYFYNLINNQLTVTQYKSIFFKCNAFNFE